MKKVELDLTDEQAEKLSKILNGIDEDGKVPLKNLKAGQYFHDGDLVGIALDDPHKFCNFNETDRPFIDLPKWTINGLPPRTMVTIVRKLEDCGTDIPLIDFNLGSEKG